MSSDWSDTKLDIAVTFFYHPIFMIIATNPINLSTTKRNSTTEDTNLSLLFNQCLCILFIDSSFQQFSVTIIEKSPALLTLNNILSRSELEIWKFDYAAPYNNYLVWRNASSLQSWRKSQIKFQFGVLIFSPLVFFAAVQKLRSQENREWQVSRTVSLF